MKSVIQEGSSLAKAIEQGWIKAGKPREFTVKIFQEAKKNFFGMTVIAAKVGIFFKEAQDSKDIKSEGRPQQQQRQQQKSQQPYRPQQKKKFYKNGLRDRNFQNRDGQRDNRDTHRDNRSLSQSNPPRRESDFSTQHSSVKKTEDNKE
jgi:hypothetical protein